ncbi:MAG: T9SS type A sorting domain-containing protein [Paludibacteraceae bacterium]|nr:T9SS type A sorting domain-containing protein [Paludibacteraceae bacterium]
MKKKSLLVAFALSFAFIANSAEKEFYVIKDGKMVNCEFHQSLEPDSTSFLIEESVNAVGDSMVMVKNPVAYDKSGLLYLPEGIDLSEAWNLEVEYYFDEGTELTPDCIRQECLTFDLMADTFSFTNAKWESNPKQKEYRIAHVSIDARQRDFYSYVDGKSVLDNHGVGKLRSVTKYVYSSPLMPKKVADRGDGNIVKAIFIALFPKSGTEIVGYIKNLKFVSDGTKPFYADKMTILENEGTIDTSSFFTNYVYASNGGNHADAEIGELESVDGELEDPTQMYGQQLFISNSPQGDANKILNDRMYCDYGEQGAVDFYDTEYGYLPYIGKANDNERIDDDGVAADAQLRIPLFDAVKDTVSIAMRLGHNSGTSGGKTPYADYMAASKDIRFPVEYRFEAGDAQRISAKTEWKRFRPTYTKGGDDYVDSIPTMMSMVYGDVELPPMEYSYITLRFIPNDVISYMFGDIRLTGDTDYWPRRADDFVLSDDYLGNRIPVAMKSCCCDPNFNDKNDNAVEDIIAMEEASIYPNPATDVITVTNEGVKHVDVYSVAGSLVASSESDKVNISKLQNGLYIVKAKTETEVITGTVFKK